MPPDVTILIPTYARSRWLEEALHCALWQDYCGHLRVLVVNDCQDQVLTCASPHENLTIINVSPFRTLGAKRNAMLEMASTEWVTFLDDDDLAVPWYVSRMVVPAVAAGARSALSELGYFVNRRHWTVSPIASEFAGERRHMLALGGCDETIDAGENRVLRARLREDGRFAVVLDQPGAYVYRWDAGTYHVSAKGLRNDGVGFRRDAERRMASGAEPTGIVELVPRLHSEDPWTYAPPNVRTKLLSRSTMAPAHRPASSSAC